METNRTPNMIGKYYKFNCFNASAGETGTFQENRVNIMAADALAPCGARSSTVMVLFMQDKQVLVFHKEVCHLYSQSPRGGIMPIVYILSKRNSAR